MAEFTAWPKTPRLFRDIIVSEKIDGTNAAIHIEVLAPEEALYDERFEGYRGISDDMTTAHGFVVRVTAQSRKRLIYPGKGTDNYGFAEWVRSYASDIADVLGPGLHYGEWWGAGINRNYGEAARHFSLFNTDKHRALDVTIGGSRVRPVPVLYQGPFRESEITGWLARLAQHGSIASTTPFDDPEGICVWHSQTRSVFKVTLDNNDAGKWEAAQNG